MSCSFVFLPNQTNTNIFLSIYHSDGNISHIWQPYWSFNQCNTIYRVPNDSFVSETLGFTPI